jgi:hypothetical protein
MIPRLLASTPRFDDTAVFIIYTAVYKNIDNHCIGNRDFYHLYALKKERGIINPSKGFINFINPVIYPFCG